MVPLSGRGYSVAFDPLDGSSIVDANFAVGSIFGVWPGPSPLGQRGRDQAAAAYSVYGPRTVLVVAYADGGGSPVVQQYVQHAGRSGAQRWVLQRAHAGLRHTKIIAPANLRAAADNGAYRELMDAWISGGYKLRYSGGMVPDVHHILAKVGPLLRPAPLRAARATGRFQALDGRVPGGCHGLFPRTRGPLHRPSATPPLPSAPASRARLERPRALSNRAPPPLPRQGGGVFCNPASPKSPAKLRLLYECAPLAYVIEAAGGASYCGRGSVLDLAINDTGAKTTIAVGTREDVETCLAAMRASPRATHAA